MKNHALLVIIECFMIYCKGTIKVFMHAFLITHGSKEDRQKKIASLVKDDQIHPVDIRTLVLDEDAASIGIAIIRNWQKQLLLMPTASPLAAGVIESADLLTPEAQNALLKTLEEPPIHTHIYMEAQSDHSFLPTILSRCHSITLHDAAKTVTKEEEAIIEVIQQLLTPKTTIGQTLATLDTLCKNKNDAGQWVEHAIRAMHKTKSDWSTHVYTTLEKHLMDTKKYLAANVSYKLVLDEIFLSFMTRQS